MVWPDMEVTTSPGLTARPLGMFSQAAISTTRLIFGLSSTTARSAPSTEAAPPMSNFISSMPAPGFSEMPPESKVMPLPTSTMGACVIALGGVRSGMYASDDELAAALSAAGETALDPCWRLPLDDDYADGLKTNFADVANVAGREGGSITAAKFLQRFASKYRWGHLDIAGTAWKGGGAKGATGRPVGLLTHFVLSQVR